MLQNPEWLEQAQKDKNIEDQRTQSFEEEARKLDLMFAGLQS